MATAMATVRVPWDFRMRGVGVSHNENKLSHGLRGFCLPASPRAGVGGSLLHLTDDDAHMEHSRRDQLISSAVIHTVHPGTTGRTSLHVRVAAGRQ